MADRRWERPIRVLVVLTSDARRGAEIEGSRLARELSDGDVEVDVVALAASDGPESLAVPVLGASTLGPSTLRALRRRGRRADLVIAYGSRTLPACAIALLGTRTGFVYRSIGDPAAWAPPGWRRRRTRWLMRRAALVVALWPDGEDAIRTLYDVDRTTSIPNARSPDEFHPVAKAKRARARSDLRIGHGEVMVLWVGSLTPEKRLDRAVEAVSLLPDNHVLVVAGDGPQRGELEALVAGRLGDRGRFLGVRTDMTIPYAAADLVLSTSSTEGMPGVLIEAGLSALRVVATDVGAVPWLFQRGVGGEVCARDGSAELVARAVGRVLSAGEADDRLDGVARIAAACGWGAVVASWRSVLDEYARKTPPGPLS